ncbi:hypothetical protein LPJ66_002707 [Kickxella alabastrina]|uniref:Uncharacterized protein n=1 Tax=Kickxella alabastrina TaxID=61397 RepID=A0ACC1IPP8_9FUNG|nr:hypothetical protein LPJ66_002707 [Kickxella alabastrina]
MLEGASLCRPLEDVSDEEVMAVDHAPSKRMKHSHETAADSTIFEKLGLPIQKALTKSYTFFSPLPEASTDEYVLGVDEAGRGPVLGPMVYATCFCKESYYAQLSTLGFADSKQLNEDQRDRLFAVIQQDDVRESSGWSIRCISPQDISQCMLRRSKYNLNSLAHDATIQLIRDALDRGINLKRVFIDTVGPPVSYQKKLEGLFPGIQITVAKKADSLYPIVSAASICAKVTRDAHLSRWVFAEAKLQNNMSNVYGSGYPGDPNTIRWLKESLDQVFGYPGIIRFSWSTCARILLEQAVAVVWADDEDAPNNASLVKYFAQAKASSAAAAGSDNPARPRSKFFGHRRPINISVSL